MRIKPGPIRHTSTDGTVVHIDQRLGREQVDVLVRVIRAAGLTPNTCTGVVLSEAGSFAEALDLARMNMVARNKDL